MSRTLFARSDMNTNEATLVLSDEYNRMAETYDRVVAPRYELLAREVADLLAPAPGGMVLDVGTGTGVLACLLAARVAPTQAVAIDLSDEALRVASFRAGREGIRNIRFEMMDVRNIVYRSRLFDGVGSNLGIPDFGYDRTFYEVHRLLKPDGRFVFSEWDRDPGPTARTFYELEAAHGTTRPSKELALVREALDLSRTTAEAKDLKDPAAVARRLSAQGFAAVEDRPKVFTVPFGSAEDYVAFMAGFGWHERELREMPPEGRRAFDAAFGERVRELTGTGGLEETWHVHFYIARP